MSRKAGNESGFAAGTAARSTLALQTILPALMTAKNGSTFCLEGGTHNSAAPPFDFLKRSYLPLPARMGPKVVAQLERAGFYPAGGGKINVDITPAENLRPVVLQDRGAGFRTSGTVASARLGNGPIPRGQAMA